MATYAGGLGLPCGAVLADGRGGLTDLAHAEGLVVHAWTARDENRFLPQRYRRGFFADNLRETLECLPEHLWSMARRKREYVASVLARAEVGNLPEANAR